MKIGRLFVLVLVLLLLVFGSCSKKSDSSDEDGIISLVLMYPETGDEAKPILEIMKTYQEMNPHIRIKGLSVKSEDSATTLPVQFSASKTPADIVGTTFTWFIKEQAEKGHLADISSVINKDDFLQGAFDAVTLASGVYGGPFSGGITSLEYRKSFFEKNNLPDPKSLKTWDEFLNMVDQANKIDGVDGAIGTGGGVGWPLTSIVESFILTFGGLEMHKQLTAGTLLWQDPEVKRIFVDKLLPLIRNGSFGAPDEFSAVLQAMWNGKHALFWGDSTDSATVSPSEDRGVALIPGQEALIFWKSYFFIPAYSEHPDEALDFLRFLLTEGQGASVKAGGRIASYKNIDPSEYPPAEQEVVELIRDSSVTDDMDDAVGGRFQAAMWEQWFLVWADPTEETLDNVLFELDEARKLMN